MQSAEKLNDRQQEAVFKTDGPVIVLAGAGTGKTRVLTNRIAHLINILGISPYNILAVTFTNKAAREMKERIEKIVDVDLRHLWVQTFHSMCARILRMELVDFEGYNQHFNIIDDEDRVKILRDIIKELNYDPREVKPNDIKAIISKAKNFIEQDYGVNSYDFYIQDLQKRDPISYKIIKKYDEQLKKENLLDFDDLILVTLKLLVNNETTRLKYQNRFSYILVDEFQDTNDIQYLLVSLLAKVHRNLFVVGDQDQSIYSFRGANVGNINKFMDEYKGCEVILLEENYRSTSQILKIANNVINVNKERVSKVLFTKISDGPKPLYFRAQSSYEEAVYVAEKIKKYVDAGYKYSDIAILYRANYVSRNFEDILVKHKIPYVIYGGKSFFERKEIKDMIAYLRLVLNSNDDFQFKRVVNEPKRKIGDALLGKLTAASVANDVSLFEAIDYIQSTGIGVANLIGFKFTILELKEEFEGEYFAFSDIIDHILEKTGYTNMLKEEGETGAERLENIKEFKSALAEIEDFYEGTRIEKLAAFLSDLALRTNDDNKDESDNKVKLMTFHQAKGLEYPIVFMVAMEESIFPSSLSYTPSDIEEERRICYVGITRARKELVITNAKSRFYNGAQSNFPESRFVKEMNMDDLEIIGEIKRTITPVTINSAKLDVKEEPKVEVSLEKGDKINHKLFGDGVIVSRDGRVITVAFAQPQGIKKLLADHPAIRKI